MVETRKLMQKKSDGTDEQYYPETHVVAVLGLMELLKKYQGEAGWQSAVNSINGKIGDVFITRQDLGIVLATSTSDGLLSKEMYLKIQEMNDAQTGTAENLANATEQSDGLMSSEDKTQLTRLAKYNFVNKGEI